MRLNGQTMFCGITIGQMYSFLRLRTEPCRSNNGVQLINASKQYSVFDYKQFRKPGYLPINLMTVSQNVVILRWWRATHGRIIQSSHQRISKPVPNTKYHDPKKQFTYICILPHASHPYSTGSYGAQNEEKLHARPHVVVPLSRGPLQTSAPSQSVSYRHPMNVNDNIHSVGESNLVFYRIAMDISKFSVDKDVMLCC